MLFKTSVHVADVYLNTCDPFALYLQKEMQNAMRRGMLRPHVEFHEWSNVRGM
jgi:hypothetical protein